jgi:hypothetical protein
MKESTELGKAKFHHVWLASICTGEIGNQHLTCISKLPHAEQQRAFEAACHTAWNGGNETRILPCP